MAWSGPMLALVAAVALAATSSTHTAVMVQARTGLAGEEFKKATAVIDAELARVAEAWGLDETQKRLKLAGLGDPASCGGKQACLIELGRKLGASWVVLLSVSKVGRDRAWALAAFEVASSKQVAHDEWLDEQGADVSVPVVKFADGLAPVVRPPPPPDVPVATKLEPPVVVTPPPPPPLEVATPAKPTRVAPIAFAVGAGVAAAAAVGLAVGAAATAGPLSATTPGPNGERLSSLSPTQARAAADTSNALSVSAIAAGVVAAGLGVGAVLTW